MPQQKLPNIACTFFNSALAPGYTYSWRKDTECKSEQGSIYVVIFRKIPKEKRKRVLPMKCFLFIKLNYEVKQNNS